MTAAPRAMAMVRLESWGRTWRSFSPRS